MNVSVNTVDGMDKLSADWQVLLDSLQPPKAFVGATTMANVQR